MDVLDLDSLDPDQPPQRWLNCGKPEFLIRYCSPAEFDRFSRTLQRKGIWDLQGKTLDGRAGAFHLESAKCFVLDWRGVTEKGQPAEYTPEKMARIFGSRTDVLAIIKNSIEETASFFAPNGGPLI